MTRALTVVLAALALAACGDRYDRAIGPGVEPTPQAAVSATATPYQPEAILARIAEETSDPAPCEEGRHKPGLRRCFYMVDPAGNAALAEILVRADRLLADGASRSEVMAAVRARYLAAADRFYDAQDTVVTETFADALDTLLEAAGMRRVAAIDEFAF